MTSSSLKTAVIFHSRPNFALHTPKCSDIASGAPIDNFEGFELISRLHAPETGEVFVTFKADNHLAISEHFGVWRAKFGLEWNITAVLNDEEVIQRNKQVADAVAAMG